MKNYHQRMDSLPLNFLAPLTEYLRQADALLTNWRAGDQAALNFFHDHHPRFRREDVAWLPQSLSEQQMRGEEFTLEDAQLAVARACAFLDWQSLEAWVSAIESRDPAVYPFEAAVEAVVNGEIGALRRLLRENPALVNERSTRRAPFDPPVHRCTLLHYIAANGVEGQRQMTPYNAVEIAKLLLDAGADPNALADLYGGECTTLSLLVSSSHPAQAKLQGKLAELLIDRGAALEPHGSGNWTNPLMTALIFGFGATAEVLVRKGAPIDTLAAAAGLGRTEQAIALLPTSTEEDRNRAMALATQFGHVEVVRALLSAGVDPNRYNPEGMHSHATPLHQAALAGHLAVVQILIEHGAKLDVKDTIYNANPLDWALHADQQDVATFLKAATAG